MWKYISDAPDDYGRDWTVEASRDREAARQAHWAWISANRDVPGITAHGDILSAMYEAVNRTASYYVRQHAEARRWGSMALWLRHWHISSEGDNPGDIMFVVRGDISSQEELDLELPLRSLCPDLMAHVDRHGKFAGGGQDTWGFSFMNPQQQDFVDNIHEVLQGVVYPALMDAIIASDIGVYLDAEESRRQEERLRWKAERGAREEARARAKAERRGISHDEVTLAGWKATQQPAPINNPFAALAGLKKG